MQPLHSGIISIPGSPKTWTWKQSPILAPQITEKSQKGVQSGSRETPKMTLKSVDPVDVLRPWLRWKVYLPKVSPYGQKARVLSNIVFFPRFHALPGLLLDNWAQIGPIWDSL